MEMTDGHPRSISFQLHVVRRRLRAARMHVGSLNSICPSSRFYRGWGQPAAATSDAERHFGQTGVRFLQFNIV